MFITIMCNERPLRAVWYSFAGHWALVYHTSSN